MTVWVSSIGPHRLGESTYECGRLFLARIEREEEMYGLNVIGVASFDPADSDVLKDMAFRRIQSRLGLTSR